MHYEWDSRKAKKNFEKHGVDFADAVGALEDELGLTMPDLHCQSEQRFITVGMDLLGRLLVVIYSWRNERIRLISARRATSRERRQYEEG